MLKFDKRYNQGVFRPKNKQKYIGNSDPIYRSNYELTFFRWCDGNDRVIKWGSENIVVPYTSPIDGKVHRYFVDNYVHFKNRDGNIQKLLIEIKPKKYLQRPVQTKGKHKKTLIYEQTTYLKNQAKWEAARKWAKKHGSEFCILTENELNIK